MLRQSLRPFLLFVLAFPGYACAQSSAPACDLSYFPQPKAHFEFVDRVDPEISVLLENGYRNVHNGTDAFTSALRMAESKQDVCGEALAEFGLSAAIDSAGNSETDEHLGKAEILFSSLGAAHALAQVHYTQALRLNRSGKTKEAYALAMRAAEEMKSSGDPQRAINLKISAIRLDETMETAEALNELVQEARRAESSDAEGIVLHLLGDREFAAGHYATALEQYGQSRQVLEKCKCDDGELATLLVSMGRLERVQGQPRQALKDYAIALKLQEVAGEREYSIQTMNAMAVSYEALGLHQEALEQYQHALSNAEAIGATRFIPFLEGNIGGQYLHMKQYANAVRELRKVVALGGSDYLMCIRKNQLSEALLDSGQTQDASEPANEAVAVCRKNKDRDNLADALETRAAVGTSLKRYEPSLDDVREALKIREDIRSHLVPDDARKQGYNERIQSLFDTSIDLLTRMDRKREALDVAEQGRARAFLDLMGTQQSGEPTPAEQVAVDAPSFASYVSAAPATADQMIEAAQHYHSTLLAYWASDSQLFIWVVGQDGAISEACVQVTNKRLKQLVERAANPKMSANAGQSKEPPVGAVSAPGGDAATVAVQPSRDWRKLYEYLIAPVEPYLPKRPGSLLTIIPHHELFRLSFAALIDSHAHYLVERYALHTVPAAALLRYTQQNEARAEQAPTHFLLVANASSAKLESGLSLPALPATLREVREISQLLPAGEVTTLTGPQANEETVVHDLQSATEVHFATHAVLDDSEPHRSFLLFYSPPNSSHPVRLTTNDIYRLKLHTGLVVLSACRTGLGKVTGDGIDGFSRAFFYAGTASFLATLWDVADQPTAMLLPRFYRELQAGASRSAALRTAELGLIARLRAGKMQASTGLGPVTLPENPIFWASFSLSGEP